MQTNRISRRELGALALGGLALPSAAETLFTEYRGVRLGVGSFPYRTIPLDELIRVMQTAGAGLLELEASFVEPVAPGAQRGAGRQTPEQREWIRQWRLSVPLDEISAIRGRLDKAGIELSAYAMPINATYTDAEMERAFQIAKALRAPALNTQVNIPLARKLASLAEKYEIPVGLHPAGAAANPESIGNGGSYARVFAISTQLRANLDQHLFRDWGPEPLDFVRQYHERISTIHFHDRRVMSEPHDWLPFGEGDTPVREMLLLAKAQSYRFPFSIEVVYRTDDLSGEIRREIDYCRRVLD